MSDEPIKEVSVDSRDYEKLVKDRDAAYWERNQLVAALSKLFPSYLAKHPDSDKEWEHDWRNIVVVNIPKQTDRTDLLFHTDGGRNSRNYGFSEYYQLTWHIHDFDMPMFDHLSRDYGHEWDGHTTEAKYQALRTLIPPTKKEK